ncbi:MAG: DUF4249 domain-containing protein [Bacteroidales bacterium]|jgi:hypothetical protein|nr:DUF4249 domain-containing protein [Bacteroidales bacterium]
MKTKTSIYEYIVGLLIITVLSPFVSCTEDTTIKTGTIKKIPVIYGTVTDINEYQQIEISSSADYFSKEENETISGASVTMEEDSALEKKLYSFIEDPPESGIYRTYSEMAGKPGWTYVIHVKMDFDGDGNAETYEAESTMPELVKLDSLNITKNKEGQFTLYSLNIYAQDPGGEKNYYLCSYSVNGTLYDQISKYFYFDDTSLDGEYVNKLPIYYFFDIGDKDKFDDDDVDDMVFLSGGEQIILNIANITKGFYNFIDDCQTQKDGSNPFFGGPPANISTNLSGGAKGYFTAFAISSATAKVPENPAEE